MGRGKLSMKLISNEKSRKTTFHKRNRSLMRKAYELSTLCDVRTCVFVYGPSQNDQSPVEVHTWPPCRDEVNEMIASYKANCLHKRARKAFDLLDFFSERKKKIEGEMSKLHKDVVEARFPKWDERLDHLSEDDLRVVMVELDSKLEATKRRMEVLTENNHEQGNTQTLNANMNKQKQVMLFKEESSDYNNMFGSSSIMETQAIMPFHHQYQYHQYHQIQTMDHELENLSQYIFGSNGSSPQFQFNHGSNFFTDPPNGMIMDNKISTQNFSMCHNGLPLPLHHPLASSQSILPLSYMQLTDDQMIMACASNSQMGLSNNASTQLNDQLDLFNYEYFMKTNNF